MALQPFTWSGGGEKLTPAQAAARRKVAEALLGPRPAATTFGGGLAEIGNALRGVHAQGQADAADAEHSTQRKAIMDALIGNPDPTMTDIYGALGNDVVSSDPGSAAILQALAAQEVQQNDPLRQLQLEKLGLEVEGIRNPPPDKPDYGFTFAPDGTMIRTDKTSGGFEEMGEFAKPVPGFTLVSPEEAAALGLPNGSFQKGPDGKIYEIGGSNTNVNVNMGDGAPGLGKLSPDYGYVLDPESRQPVIDPATGLPTAAPVPGSPAAVEAQQAAAAQSAQEGAQLSSNIEGAEKTLASTRNVLEILDNTDGQPTTGTLSRPFAMLSNTPAGRIRSYVSTLQSGVALGAMQRLKEASSTGATGFGALSAPELNLLISDIGALDPDNTEPDIFRETVQRIEDRSKRVVADIRRNVSPERIAELGLQEFLDTFDPPANQSSPDNIDDILKGYGL